MIPSHQPSRSRLVLRVALAVSLGVTVAPLLCAQIPRVAPGGIVNAASFSATPLAAGSPASVFGANLGPATPVFPNTPPFPPRSGEPQCE